MPHNFCSRNVSIALSYFRNRNNKANFSTGDNFRTKHFQTYLYMNCFPYFLLNSRLVSVLFSRNTVYVYITETSCFIVNPVTCILPYVFDYRKNRDPLVLYPTLFPHHSFSKMSSVYFVPFYLVVTSHLLYETIFL